MVLHAELRERVLAWAEPRGVSDEDALLCAEDVLGQAPYLSDDQVMRVLEGATVCYRPNAVEVRDLAAQMARAAR